MKNFTFRFLTNTAVCSDWFFPGVTSSNTGTDISRSWVQTPLPIHIITRFYQKQFYFTPFLADLQKKIWLFFLFLLFHISLFNILFFLSSSYMQYIHTCSLCSFSLAALHCGLKSDSNPCAHSNIACMWRICQGASQQLHSLLLPKETSFPIFLKINFRMRMLRNILFIEPQVLRTDRHVALLNKFYFISFRNFIFEKQSVMLLHIT